MEQHFQRREIADGVFFSHYIDRRFKINRIDIIFTDTLERRRAGFNALIPAVLSRSNSRYPTMRELNERLSELYSASLGDIVKKNGDVQLYGLFAAAIDDAYAIDNEKVLSELVHLLCDCLFSPALENGYFPENSLDIQKQNLIDNNDAEINDKRTYAARKGIELAFENEPAALSVYGENDEIRKITAREAFEYYKNMLKTANAEVICVGSGDFSEAEKIIGEAFRRIGRKPLSRPESRKSPKKDEVRTVTEKMSVSQSKLSMSFKSGYENLTAMRVMSALLGGDVSSKLFTVVREKLSLCYYCYSHLTLSKGAMNIESGVEPKNLKKAKTAILEQLSDIQNGNFTDEDVEKIKRSIMNDLRSVNDRVGNISNWYLNRILEGEIFAPEELLKRIGSVTRENIIEAANSFTADSVYIITSEEEADE